MKTLPAMIAASLLIASVSATAASDYETVLMTPVAPTKAAAYELGVNKLAALNDSSPAQLSRSLGTSFGDIQESSLRLKDGGYVTVQERADASGRVGYVGQVNVGVSYEMHDSDD